MMKNNFLIMVVLIFALFLLTGCRDWFGDNEQPDSVVTVNGTSSKIIIISPEYGSTWKPGGQLPVEWTAGESIEKIKIELFRKTNYQFTIVSESENDGLLEWHIPSEINPSVHYLIKVSDYNNPGNYVFSRQFAILD